MKKSVALSAFSIVSALTLVALPAFSEENEKTTVAEYCTANNDLGLSHGACVAYFTTHNVAPHDASVCQNTRIQNILGVTNHGQCMKKLADMRQ